MKVIVTHRGTIESIMEKQRDMKLRANYPMPNCKIMRLLEDNKKVVWVSKGEPNWVNKILSGMVGKKGEAYITFEIEEARLRKPNGILKHMFGYKLFRESQLVIEGDVDIPRDARFSGNETLNSNLRS